jgi:hypothetical protein
VFELLKMAHLIAVAMVSGLLLAFYIVLRASARRETEPGLNLARRTIIDVIGFSVALVWISGLTLLWSRYGAGDRELSAWFYAKIGAAMLFTLAIVMQRVDALHRPSGQLVLSRRIAERWVSIAWLMALLTVCLAVISFG